MPSAARKGDLLQPHSGYTNQYLTEGSPNVKVNNIPVSRVADGTSPHTNSSTTHSSTQGSGSPTVKVNGQSVARVHDSIKCGSTNRVGSPSVIIN